MKRNIDKKIPTDNFSTILCKIMLAELERTTDTEDSAKLNYSQKDIFTFRNLITKCIHLLANHQKLTKYHQPCARLATVIQ